MSRTPRRVTVSVDVPTFFTHCSQCKGLHRSNAMTWTAEDTGGALVLRPICRTCARPSKKD